MTVIIDYCLDITVLLLKPDNLFLLIDTPIHGIGYFMIGWYINHIPKSHLKTKSKKKDNKNIIIKQKL